MKSKIVIITFFTLFLTSNLIAAEKKHKNKPIKTKITKNVNKNFIYITRFKNKSNKKELDYYKDSLPDSVRTVIKKKLSITKGKKELTFKQLLNSGYAFYIKGSFRQKKQSVYVTFSVIKVKTRSSVVIAFAHGKSKGSKIFDMIDGLTKVTLKSLKDYEYKATQKTKILSVDKDGKIKTTLKGMDLSDGDFTGADLSGRDLTGTVLTNANFTRAKLNNAIFEDVIFDNSILKRADFTNANIKGADFTKAKMISVYNNFEEAENVKKAEFKKGINHILNTPAYFLSISFGPGMSYGLYETINGGSIYTVFAGNISAKLIIKTDYFFGFFTGLGYNWMGSKEEKSGLSIAYDLHYFYLDLGLNLKFPSFTFYTGFSAHFIIRATKTTGSTEETDLGPYNRMVFGIVTGANFVIGRFSGNIYTMGVDFKFLLENFLKSTVTDKKIFAVYLSLGVMLSL